MRHTNTVIGIGALALGLTLATGTLAGSGQKVPQAEFQVRACQTCQVNPAVHTTPHHLAGPAYHHGVHPVPAPAHAPLIVPAKP